MKTVTEVFFDPTIYGHRLVEPVQWYGRHVAQIFTCSFSDGLFSTALEVIVRTVTFVALVCLSPFLTVAAPCALLGWAIKYYSQPTPLSSNPEVSPLPLPTSPHTTATGQETSKASPINPVSPSPSFSPPNSQILQPKPRTPEPSPINPAPPASSFVSLTPQILQPEPGTPGSFSITPAPLPFSSVPLTPEQAAKREVEELINLYNGLKDLNSSAAQKLFSGIKSFEDQYKQYRNSDPFTVDNMTKTFNTFDAIATNAKGMQAAWQRWFDFYKVQADAQGVIPQPKDGNCWLHTSLVGLQLINHPDLGGDTHETLRPKVVEWMHSNYATDKNLQRFIANAREAHITVETHRLREEYDSLRAAITGNLIPSQGIDQAKENLKNYENQLKNLKSFSLEDYFNHMKKIGAHGTHAELYAISKIFQVNIAIWRELSLDENLPVHLTKEWDEQIEYPGAEHTVNAVLTQEGNHFNYRLPQSSTEAKKPS